MMVDLYRQCTKGVNGFRRAWDMGAGAEQAMHPWKFLNSWAAPLSAHLRQNSKIRSQVFAVFCCGGKTFQNSALGNNSRR
jgi:hypothetical protein